MYLSTQHELCDGKVQRGTTLNAKTTVVYQALNDTIQVWQRDAWTIYQDKGRSERRGKKGKKQDSESLKRDKEYWDLKSSLNAVFLEVPVGNHVMAHWSIIFLSQATEASDVFLFFFLTLLIGTVGLHLYLPSYHLPFAIMFTLL